jgi:hypothetical protein
MSLPPRPSAGTVNVSRSIWKDAAFKAQPFTEREAFLWMIMEASYRTREKRLGNTIFSLNRGQLVTSIRFMAEAWKWEKSTVDRFIQRLKKRDMIGTLSGTDGTVITICNYSLYQDSAADSGTPENRKRDTSGTPAGHQRDKLESSRNPVGIQKLQQQQGASAENPIFRGVMNAVGVDPDNPPRYWRGTPATTHILGWQLAHGLTVDEVIEAARASRQDHPDDVPAGPKALDQHMARFAKAKAAAAAPKPARRTNSTPKPAAAPATREQKMRFYAEAINGDKFLVTTQISAALARDMISAGLVTPERMAERGVQI